MYKTTYMYQNKMLFGNKQYKLSNDIRLSKFNKVEHHIHLVNIENIYEHNKNFFLLGIYLKT